jgi:hypothetical protein
MHTLLIAKEPPSQRTLRQSRNERNKYDRKEGRRHNKGYMQLKMDYGPNIIKQLAINTLK